MPHHSRDPLLPTEEVLSLLDQTVTDLSKCAVDYAQSVGTQPGDAPCQYQWHKLEKAARTLLKARQIENESLAAVSILSAQKELISRALALLDCVTVTGGLKEGAAPNLRQPGRKTRKHPWGKRDDDGAEQEA